MFDRKSSLESRVQRRFFFVDAGNCGALRASLQFLAKFAQLRSAAYSVSFDAAVRQVFRIAAKTQALRHAHGEIPVADPLHHTTDEITSGLADLRRVCHG